MTKEYDYFNDHPEAKSIVDSKSAGFSKCPNCGNYSYAQDKGYCYNGCKFQLKLIPCEPPKVQDLECYRNKFIDNNKNMVMLYGRKHEDGVYISTFEDNKIKWYKLIKS